MHPLVGKYLFSCAEYQQETQRNTLRLNFIQSIPLLKWIWANISLDFTVGLPSLWDCDITYAVVARLSTKNLASSSIRISLQQVEWPNCSFLTFGSSVVSREAGGLFVHIYVADCYRAHTDHREQLKAYFQTERTNRTLVQYLPPCPQQNSSRWLDFLPWLE